jgi:membrane-associated phospholipid phosphatase
LPWAPWTGKWGAGQITLKASKRETSSIAAYGAWAFGFSALVAGVAGFLTVVGGVVLGVLAFYIGWISFMAFVAERNGRCLWVTAYGARLPGAMHFNFLAGPGRC